MSAFEKDVAPPPLRVARATERPLGTPARKWHDEAGASVARRDVKGLAGLYLDMRRRTESLIEPLDPEDMTVQSMPDASPTKWHLAHTSWFFETFLLVPRSPNYAVFNASYAYLFNSYYESMGARHPRPQRGLLTRPTVREVVEYRHHVDHHMVELLQSAVAPDIEDLVRLGLAHEEQHQELLLMDVLHLFSQSPILPAYQARWPAEVVGRRANFVPVGGGLVETGHAATGFAFDNEGPQHTVFLQPFEIADRLVTNGEWLKFMADGGYRRAECWLADGWALAQAEGWEAPFYWRRGEDGWSQMGLGGPRTVDPDSAVRHVSYYEADAFARWAGARLPTESEWEAAATAGQLEQVDDTAWQWTMSAYLPYPGFRPAPSAVGEYNGKFMINQMVLRGGASITPRGHSRLPYRNFYQPKQRWMFSGVRLARDASKATEPRGPKGSGFARDVLAGLGCRVKTLSPKYFYDATGSALFEAICETPEYYLTRSETTLLRSVVGEIANGLPAGAALVEFGNGASTKTQVLLDAAPHVAAYVPIDISIDALDAAAAALRGRYPRLDVLPVAGDFTAALSLPPAIRGLPRVGFFPGSTIGNFVRSEAVHFLASVRALLGQGSRLILGADLVKDTPTLVAAYNDAEGVTARFNMNLLVRINRELAGNFDLAQFEHVAVWNAELSRMEMHLVSLREQTVTVLGHQFGFAAGERLHTENSHKFTVASMTALAAEAGWRLERHWISAAPEFAIFALVAA